MAKVQKKSKGKKRNRLPGRATTPQEIKMLLQACGKGPAGLRNAAFIALCAGAGLRCFEALEVLPSHIEKIGNGTTIRVIRGKGGKSRIVALMDEFKPFIDLWIERRKNLEIGGRSPLICGITRSEKENSLGGQRNTFGKHVSTALMRSTIKRLAKNAGIETRVHIHGLRHSMATAWVASGIELRAISQQLGHVCPSTTDSYLGKITANRLISAASEVKMFTSQ